MATTLKLESFAKVNIRERSRLFFAVEAGAEELRPESTEGFVAGQTIYVGELAREGCERAVIDAVTDATTLTLTSPLERAHSAYSAVTAVLGDRIRIYRAPNVDGEVPAAESFTVLATRSINPDHPMTYYTDSSGGAEYWYTYTYFNETTTEETPLSTSSAVRGDDFKHYANLTDIRAEAGFKNAHNLSDNVVDQQRRAAESEINAALAGIYTVPFDPVPEIIRTLTIQLAAALLQVQAYGNVSPYSTALTTARAALQAYADQSMEIVDEDGNPMGSPGVSSYPGPDEPRMFRIEDIY